MPRSARAVLWNDSQIDIAMRVVLECLLQGKALKHWHCVVPVQLAVNLHAYGFAVRRRCEHRVGVVRGLQAKPCGALDVHLVGGNVLTFVGLLQAGDFLFGRAREHVYLERVIRAFLIESCLLFACAAAVKNEPFGGFNLEGCAINAGSGFGSLVVAGISRNGLVSSVSVPVVSKRITAGFWPTLYWLSMLTVMGP